ncbi:MAG: hypothetical protein NTX57_06715 [Armatimonadetes bacterium]|nr:hypothetical protein [Armatimonadota bacterium]
MSSRTPLTLPTLVTSFHDYYRSPEDLIELFRILLGILHSPSSHRPKG